MDDAISIGDIQYSVAYEALDYLFDSGDISIDGYQRCKRQYAWLYQELLSMLSKELHVQEAVRILEKQIQSPPLNASSSDDGDAAPSPEQLIARGTIHSLRVDLELLKAQVSVREQHLQELQSTLDDLGDTKVRLQARMATLRDVHKHTIETETQALKLENKELQRDVLNGTEKLHTAMADRNQLAVALSELEGEISTAANERTGAQGDLEALDPVPARTRKAADALVLEVKEHRVQELELTTRLKEAEKEESHIASRISFLQGELQNLKLEHKGLSMSLMAKGHAFDDMARNLAQARVEEGSIIGQVLSTALAVTAKNETLREENDALRRSCWERDRLLRRLKREQNEIQGLQELLPPMETAKRNAEMQVTQLMRVSAQVSAGFEASRRVSQGLLKDSEELQNKTKASQLLHEACEKQIKLLEREVATVKKAATDREQLIRCLASEVNTELRLVQVYGRKLQEGSSSTELLEAAKNVLERKIAELQKARGQLKQACVLLSSERNKFTMQIKAAEHVAADLRERMGLVDAETQLLMEEALSKGQLLDKSYGIISSKQLESNRLLMQMTGVRQDLEGKRAELDAEVAEMAAAVTAIRKMELRAVQLKQEVAGVREVASAMRVQGDERRQEVQQLEQQVAVLTQVADTGEEELQKDEDELRLLRLEEREALRSICVNKEVPRRINGLDVHIVSLKHELLNAQRDAEMLAEALEDPKANARWRVLGGKIPNPQRLAATAEELEGRLRNKATEAREQQQMLEQLTQLSEDLLYQAAEGYEGAVASRQKLLEAQKASERATRSLMANVSELAMVQAHALQMAEDHQHMVEALAAAEERVMQGLPVTEDADVLFERVEQRQKMREAQLQQFMERGTATDSSPASTASPRPQAYIPQELGVPKPYGALAPFKPSEAGASMRHFRPPRAVQ